MKDGTSEREARLDMVEQQLMRRGITDKRILEAMNEVPRHLFVPKELRKEAYEDRPLPLGPQQTISQPFVVAFMLQSASIAPDDRVLEVGTGSGYQTALLSKLAREVYTVELDDGLLTQAIERLGQLGCVGCNMKHGDGYQGWDEYAPFDKILVSAAAPEIPRALVRQLATHGRMVIPVGAEEQRLILIEKGDYGLHTQELGGVRFVPLRKGEEEQKLM